MLQHWIWLAHLEGMNDWTRSELLRRFGDPEDIFFLDTDVKTSIAGLSDQAKKALCARDLSNAERILEKCYNTGIRLLTLRDAAYPKRLKNISDPPLVLYYKGTLPDMDSIPVIGIVGTRKASIYGMQVARRMGYQIGRCGGAVVSGLASGVDSMAMLGALTAGQRVIGVLGCGVDIVYPRSNRELYEDVERYGCLISEFAPGTAPARWTFPKRNRIISGLSCGVLVVEAPEKSGALITARQALDQGRDVFVVPGNIDTPTCVGSNRLLRDGAIPVGCGWDVMMEYEMLFPGKIHRDNTLPEQHGSIQKEEIIPQPGDKKAPVLKKEQALKDENDKKVIDKEQSSPYSDVNDVLQKLTPEEQTVVSALGSGVRLVDDVIAETGLTTGKVLAMLTMLELKGVIKRHPGKRISMK